MDLRLMMLTVLLSEWSYDRRSIMSLHLCWYCAPSMVEHLVYSGRLNTHGKYTCRYIYTYILHIYINRELFKYFWTFAMRCCCTGVQDEKQDAEDVESLRNLLRWSVAEAHGCRENSSFYHLWKVKPHLVKPSNLSRGFRQKLLMDGRICRNDAFYIWTV